MYRCDKCYKNSKVGEKENKVVTQTRKRSYQYRIKTRKGYRTKTSEGYETVREIKICGDCYGQLQAS